MTFEHEQLTIHKGQRSGLPVAIAVHSTTRGMAVGGCRLKHYADWRDGVADVLRLAEAMTYKTAVAGLPHGGGKTVVALPTAAPLSPARRREVLLDVGDAVESLGGRYGTGPDVGTGPADMVTVGERTRWAFCRPAEHGGSGDSSGPTAEGVLAAIGALCAHRFGSADVAGLRVTLIGLGNVGTHLAKALSSAGATLTVTDVDPGRRALADAVGATWVAPDEAATAPGDLLVPAALGGLLSPDVVPLLRCAAVAGPANNQLTGEHVAAMLHERGVLWLPDPVVSAGGVIYGTGVELRGLSPEAALAEVRGIGATVTRILRAGGSPHAAAKALARERLTAA
ncbi:Glu/Leu/Phe/Val dehydrogenase dimerization domain-containing protein [Phytohabitans houttuyneae]|uniref:Glu/Leu/Phe/Val dehydrogenase dimerization domain-containing protein n=1 Tax=Phytohabitans houttuyneae TaxID=1076126 RepID=UPI0031E77FD1